jgi:hypothetical protein
MKDLTKSIGKYVFMAFAVLVVLYTSSLTIDFVKMALPNVSPIVPMFAVLVFDGGMVIWSFVFVNYAEGVAQRALSSIMTLLDFTGLSIMVLAEVFLNGQSFVDAPENLGALAVWAIAIWTIANAGASIAFHLSSPESLRKMQVQNEKDAIVKEALSKLEAKRQEMSTDVSERMANAMYKAIVAELDTDRNNGGVPDIVQTQTAIMAKDTDGDKLPEMVDIDGRSVVKSVDSAENFQNPTQAS